MSAAPSEVPDQGRAAAIFTSVVLHAGIIGLVLIIGFEAVGEARRAAAPLMVADWTPPPPLPAVTGAPPELPVPGGAKLAYGPASRARTDSATAAAAAARHLDRMEPAQTNALEARPERLARTLGFERATFDSPRAAGFAADRHRVAFVLDASGPMVGLMQAARLELGRRLAQLTPEQEYCVIVIRGNGCETVSDTPARATRASLERTMRWLTERAEPRGLADLGVALECAYKTFTPDAVCIIARGESAPQTRRPASTDTARQSLISAADRLNPEINGSRKATFLCIELLDGTPQSALQTVGRTHGGPRGYQLLSRTDLGLTPKPQAPTNTKQ